MSKARRTCQFRFYEELNEFLSPGFRRRTFEHAFDDTPSVKDRIEALGVPHTEVDLILVDDQSVGFDFRLRGGERVAVYPVFERFDISGVTRLQSRPLRNPRFILDVHLGRLAAYLRLIGFDTLYRNDFGDEFIIETARIQKRIILTRDIGLLKDSRVTHGAFLYTTRPLKQLREIIDRFQLENRIRPWTRCMKCNGEIEPLRPSQIERGQAPPEVIERFDTFSRCRECQRIYWPGSHFDRLRERLRRIGLHLPAREGTSE